MKRASLLEMIVKAEEIRIVPVEKKQPLPEIKPAVKPEPVDEERLPVLILPSQETFADGDYMVDEDTSHAADGKRQIKYEGQVYTIPLNEWQACNSLKMYNPAIKVEDGRIVYLKLMQGCFDSIPRPVNELSMLRTLDVSNSRITRIINIGNLRRLENFYAAKTDLADVLELMEHFPLKQLDLSSNYCLKDVGALLSNTRLEKISVQFTKINTLKPFTMKVNLKELRVYQTDINWKDPKEIKFMSELKMMGTHIVDDRAYYRGER